MRRPSVTRQSWVVLHRWAGLTIALFLIVVGFTGALLPWNEDLTRLARPSLSSVAPPLPGSRPLDGITLAERVGRQTGQTVVDIDFAVSPDHVASFYLAPKAGSDVYEIAWADPYTGKVRLRYRDGVLADGPQNIMPFLYRLHMNLAVGTVGRYALGIAALIWTIDCFVGFYLTLPLRRRRIPGKPATAPGWWKRWKPAWLVRWSGGRHKLTFDLHRAGGLWVWPMLFVFAWSSVAFNLREVSDPVMRVFGASAFPFPDVIAEPIEVPPIGLRAAEARGRALLDAIGRREGFELGASSALRYMPERGAYRFAARSSWDVINEGGRTAVYFSATDGRFLIFEPPVRRGAANAFTAWLGMLHVAQVFGLPYRVFVSAMGVLIVTLSITGVLIWTRKRAARLMTRARTPERYWQPASRAPVAAE